MGYVLITIAIVSGIIAYILWAPLKVTVEYRSKKTTVSFRCRFFKFKLKPNTKEKSEKKDTSNENDTKLRLTEKIRKWKSDFEEYKVFLDEIMILLQNRARFTGIYVRIHYGTGNAATTGILYGGIWALVGSVYAYLCRYVSIEYPKVELKPNFSEKELDIELAGIIEARLVHIITAVFRSVKIYSKHKKTKGEN